MTAKYHLVIHPALLAELRELHAQAQAEPDGPAAQQFEAVRQGLSALREGREAEFAGERLGRSDNHPDLRDCAEIFDVTANRLARTKGVALDELDHLPTVTPAVGPGKETGRPVRVPHLPLPPEPTRAVKALEMPPHPQHETAPST